MKKYIQIFIALAFLIPLTISHAGDVSFTLSWESPTTNADGTPLTDLAGFNAYYSMTSGDYNDVDVIDIPDPLQTTVGILLSYDILWYFVVTAYDTSGNESVWSDEVSKLKPTPDTTPPSGCSNLIVN